jgi:membrane protein
MSADDTPLFTSPFTNAWLSRGWRFLAQDVWSVDLEKLPRVKALSYKLLRVVYLTTHNFFEDKCLFRASALTYITALGLVPLLALIFSVAKGLGLYEKHLKPILTFEEAGSQSLNEAVGSIFSFVEKTDVRGLGLPALAILLFAVVKLLGTIENSFNDIWGVHKSRTLVRRFSDYLAMVIIVPIFLATAIGVTSAAETEQVIGFLKEKMYLGWLIESLAGLTSVFSMSVAFTFLFMALPNTRTRFTSAMLGGILAGILWQTAMTLHVRFQVGIANFNALYSGFAAIPIFLAWVHVSWVIVLLGAETAFAHQSEPAYRQIAQSRPSDHAFREIVALRAMVRIAKAFLKGDKPLTAAAIAAQLGVPPRPVEDVLGALIARGILAAAEGPQEDCYVPAVDLEQITLQVILDALKGTSGPVDVPPQGAMDEELDRLLARLNEEMRTSPQNRNLRDLAREAGREVETAEAVVRRETRTREA